MQYNTTAALLILSIASIVMTLVVGQMAPVLAQSVPTSSNLVKRDYSYTDDQHLTARFGNTRVCGDHMCAPGEWTKLQGNLNQAQISHAASTTKTVPSLPPSVPATPPTTPTNSTVPVSSNSTKPTTPVTAPVPTPPSAPSSVCLAVKTALGNSTAASIVTKIMSDLGCNK